MLKFMTRAVDALNAANVPLETQKVAAMEVRTAALLMRKAHRKLLADHRELDSMDALHIVLGRALGADSFITFDGGWEVVPTILVYGK